MQASDSRLQAAPSASMGISPGAGLAASGWWWDWPCGEHVAGRLSKLFSTLESSFPIIHQSQHLTRLFSFRTVADCWVLLSRNLAERKTELSYLSLLLGESCFSLWGFPSGSGGKESACSVGDQGLIPGSGRYPGEGNGNPLQYSHLGNPMDRGAWWTTVHEVTKSQTWLSNYLDFNLTHGRFIFLP